MEENTTNWVLNIFIIWVSMQLVIMGMACISTFNKIATKTFECKDYPTKTVPEWVGAFVPLALFVPTNEIDDLTERYCEDQKELQAKQIIETIE